MAWVSILRDASGRHYIGSTTDLLRRMEQHQRGHTHTTQRLGGQLDLMASREVPNLEEAHRLERKLKQKKNLQLALWLLNSSVVPGDR